MLIVHVFVHVKTDCIEAFKTASLDNARHSVCLLYTSRCV